MSTTTTTATTATTVSTHDDTNINAQCSPPKVYTRRDLEALNLLDHPVWVFDIERKAMWWANRAAVRMIWKADSLPALLDRDFATDMSAATERRLHEYLQKFARGERVSDSWTYYPNGQGPVTVYNVMSGMYVYDDDHDNENNNNNDSSRKPRMVMLNEADLSQSSDTIDQSALRGMELLRHLPVAVGQFNADGRVMEQNPEALHVFGGQRSCTCRNDKTNTNDNKTNDHYNNPGCCLRSRFVCQDTATAAWKAVWEDDTDYSADQIQQRTVDGTVRWFAVQLRRSKDPVTGERVVLYSARDVSALQAAQQAAQQADESNQAKSEFVAVMAHEMRTPLHQVLGFLELLRDSSGPLTCQQIDYLNQVETSASALMAVVNDLLDYTRLEAGQMKMERLPMDPGQVAEQCRDVIATQAKHKNQNLDVQYEYHTQHCAANPSSKSQSKPDLRVYGDPSRLRQVLLNFLGNALKFTSKGHITLKLEHVPASNNTNDENEKNNNSAGREDDDDNNNNNRNNHDTHSTNNPNNNNNNKKTIRLRFSVTDTGIGIHDDHKALIFEKYQQAHTAIARQFGGTGLGLAICKKIIVETMGGQIGVDSQVGVGSTFWFEADWECVVETEPEKTNNQQGKAAATPPPPNLQDKPPQPPTGWHILVAEDNKINQKLVASVLRRLGHTSTVVENGLLAVQAVERHNTVSTTSSNNKFKPFDAVLMDVQMPHMDGIQATQKLRQRGWTGLPILGLTADFDVKNRPKFLAIGMNDCLGKPIRMLDLKEYLHRAIDGTPCVRAVTTTTTDDDNRVSQEQ